MNGWNYVIWGYGLTALVLVGYATWVIRRGRELSPQVPPERRRYVNE